MTLKIETLMFGCVTGGTAAFVTVEPEAMAKSVATGTGVPEPILKVMVANSPREKPEELITPIITSPAVFVLNSGKVPLAADPDTASDVGVSPSVVGYVRVA